MKLSRKLIIAFLTLLILGLSFGGWIHINDVRAQRSKISLVKESLPSDVSLQELTVINGNSLHRSKNQQYRIYSHHFLIIEHRDLDYLSDIGNKYAEDTNNVYMDQYNRPNKIYHKFHDGNYWSVFKDQQCPKNFKHSHMSNRVYKLVNQRVLRSHGVYFGVNFEHHYVHHPYSFNDN